MPHNVEAVQEAPSHVSASASVLPNPVNNLPSVVLPPSADGLLALVDKWAADDSGYEESTWPELQKALEEDRLSDRPLFAE